MAGEGEGDAEDEEEEAGGQGDEAGGAVFDEPVSGAGENGGDGGNWKDQRAAVFGAPEMESPNGKGEDGAGGDSGAFGPALAGPEEGVEDPKEGDEISEGAVARILSVGPAEAVDEEQDQGGLQAGVKGPGSQRPG